MFVRYVIARMRCNLSFVILFAVAACADAPEFDARIIGPETIGPCDDMILDAVIPPSVGDQTYLWSITPTSEALDDLLSRANRPRLHIPSALLPAGTNYRVGLDVRVNGAAAGPAQITVARADLETLQVAIDGPGYLTVPPTQHIALTGRAEVPRCELLPIAYHWVQIAGAPVNLRSTFVDRNIMFFVAGELKNGDYQFELQASVQTNPPLTASTVIGVTVDGM